MRHPQRIFHFSIGIAIIALIAYAPVMADPENQTAPTATPVQASLPTPLPLLPAASQDVTAVPITRTPTPEAGAMLEAITEANVRSQPDPESDRLGTIRAGDSYSIIGRYYRWYQFQYDQSLSGVGWVFDELVNVTGNIDRIPDLSLGTPTPDVGADQAASTLTVLTQTPGGVLTATAGVGNIPLPIESGGASNTSVDILAVGSQTPLPTFTIPPNVASSSAQITEVGATLDGSGGTKPASVDIASPAKIPPILPILLLGGFGILGLMVSSIRK